MKKLGFGLMRLPLIDKNNPSDIDIEKVKEMVDTFIKNGFTYFDTAWMYCGFKSENAVKEALVSRYPREAYTLTTKLHCGYISSKEECDKFFNTQREKTGADYFDYYLLHSLAADNYEKYEQLDCFNWIQKKKADGLVKKIGFSFHDNAKLLDKILTDHPEMEFVQLQINYLDWDSEWIQSKECYEVAVKHNKPVIVMEPVKGGTLADLPEEAKELFRSHEKNMSYASLAIRFGASLDNVFMVLSGMNNMEQLLDNMSYMSDFRPLSDEELELTKDIAKIINKSTAIACTGCNYCVEGCPERIAIPEYFSLYNGDMREVEGKGWTPNSIYYDALTDNHGRAKDCIACGSCESVCPQHLPIIEDLKKVSEHFD